MWSNVLNLWESPFLTLWNENNAPFLAGPMRVGEAVCEKEAPPSANWQNGDYFSHLEKSS